MARHNKKRNSGLLYEFLLRTISRSLVEHHDVAAQKAKNLIKKYFSAGSELHREYRLINALVNAPVGSEALGHAVLNEARKAASKFDGKKLSSEKGDLIREINHFFGPDVVYSEDVQNYRDYATASSLVSYWRDEKDLDIATVVDYERVILERLSMPLKEEQGAQTDPNVDNLVVKIATEKLRKKYSSQLSGAQADILNEYVFSKDKEQLHQKISEVCTNTIRRVEEYSKSFSEESRVRFDSVVGRIQEVQSSEINDTTISKVMEILELDQEIGEI